MRGTIRFRDGAWRLQVYAGLSETGQRRFATRTVRAPDTRDGRRLAEAAMSRLLVDVDSNRAIAGRDITVEELLARWIRHHEDDWSPKTLKENRAAGRLYISDPIGATPIRRLTAADLDRLYADVRARTSGRTARRVHIILHAAYAQALRWHLVDRNPADGATPPRVAKRAITPPAPDTLAKLAAALEQADPELAVFTRLAATAGGRRGQLVALRWPDIDLDAGEITFARALTVGEAGVVEKGTKTDRAYTVALDPSTAGALRAHRSRMAERGLAVGAPLAADAFVFSAEVDCSKPWHPDSATKRFRRACRNVPGLDGVRLHDLRHFMATRMLGAGVDVRTVAGRLGHANPNVTLSVYAHFIPAADRAAADIIAGVLGG